MISKISFHNHFKSLPSISIQIRHLLLQLFGCQHSSYLWPQNIPLLIFASDMLGNICLIWQKARLVGRDVAAAPQTPNWGGGQANFGRLFGYVTIFSSADLFTTDLNCRKKLACDIISECYVILSRRI